MAAGEWLKGDFADPTGIKVDPLARELFAAPFAATADRNYADYASWQQFR
jgi:hypothetical protein